jgi:integrase family protein
MTYKNWLNECLEHYIKPVSKIRTYERYCGLSIHISKHLGSFEINELSPFILQKFITEISGKGNIKTGVPLSPNTVNAIITVLQNSLKTAFTIGLTDVYIGDKIKRPTVTEKAIECFLYQNKKAIETAILNGKKSKLIGVIICLYTGLRIGELLAIL